MLGWMILVGSLLVVVNVFEVIGGIRSLETREMLEEYFNSLKELKAYTGATATGTGSRHTLSGSGWTQGARYGRRSRAVASASPTTSRLTGS